MITRRQFLKRSAAAGSGLMLKGGFALGSAGAVLQSQAGQVLADPAAAGLSDPDIQPRFTNQVPDALAPSFKFTSKNNKFKVAVGASVQMTGLVGVNGTPVPTPVFGYGLPNLGYTWPGRTFEVQSGEPIEVKWENKLVDPLTGAFLPHLLPVDTSLHWAYSLLGYTQYTIANAGVPIVSHLHGGHTDFQFDGNPEFFFSPGFGVRGPQWVEKKYIYLNDQPAGNLWYHDHALGITRLNVYAGMAGFYFVRDALDTGMPGNAYDLPAWPYEKAYAIQDRMFLNTGELFYPAFPGEPYYDDFITGEGAILPPAIFPGGGPTALAEFFGDHMVVNGVIWPFEPVEPRNYRLHLLNGTDSRFMAIEFVAVPAGEIDFTNASTPIEFHVVGSDQGLASAATPTTQLLSEPGSRYDIVFDFKDYQGMRIIMRNLGGDEPFGGDIPGPTLYNHTDKIMAFDVANTPNIPDAFDPANIDGAYVPDVTTADRTRKVALFEGKDEFGRLQPLLGTAEPATDYLGNPINWPAMPEYQFVGLTGQMEGSIAWHSPTTENPALGAIEDWEIWNVTGDAHPVHLHLVHFDIIDREEILWDGNTIVAGDTLLDGSIATEDDETRVIPNAKALTPAGDGTYLVTQPTVQHNSVAGDPATYGMGFKIMNPTTTGIILGPPAGYVENAPKDMVTALPDQVTRIKATFDKPGRYVWHCHILSHEDHEMMRVMHVGPIPPAP